MKIILILVIAMLSYSAEAQTLEPAFISRCGPEAEMNAAAFLEQEKVDKRLNEVYQQILSTYQSDSIFISNLKKAQRIWILLRDANMEAKFPNDPKRLYGSVQPACQIYYLKQLTEDRISVLNEWIRGTEEGDVCAGSVKIRMDIEPAYRSKMYINEDGWIGVSANMKKDHRIFGYSDADSYSEKMILFSIYTSEVEGNPFECKYGAYYDTEGLKDLQLKYLSKNQVYVKVAVVKFGEVIDEVFIEKRWFDSKED